MYSTHPPEASAVIDRIQPVLGLLYEALEAGISEARDYFDQRTARVDPYLGPAIVRYSAKRLLEERGIKLDEIANNGLRFIFNGYALWILKADGDDVPTPGTSEIKQNFFQQMQLPLGQDTIGLNLLVLWHVVQTPYALAHLSLACPETGAETRDSVRLHFHVPLPHPAELLSSNSTSPSAVNTEDDLEEITPIELPRQDVGSRKE